MMEQRKKILGGVVTVLMYAACTHSPDQNQEHDRGYLLKGDTVVLVDNSTIKSNLIFFTTIEKPSSQEMTTAGVVRVIPNNYAEIAPPFAGRVSRSCITLGQKVQSGTPIMEISSSEYFTSQKNYFDAKQEFHLAELQLNRQRDLLKNGVGILRELEEAEALFHTAKSTLANAAAALKIFNVDPEHMVLGKPLLVTSPISGEVVDNNIVIGQYLKEDAPAVALIAELSNVSVIAQVKEKDVRFTQEMDDVTVQVPALSEIRIPGKVVHINQIMNEETRSLEVRINCANSDHYLKPGMYVDVQFKGLPKSNIVIPSKSVFQQEDKQFVFVKVADNQFVKRRIETASTADGDIVVSAGLAAGEVIVSEGGFLMIRNY